MNKKIWAIFILCGCIVLCGCKKSQEVWEISDNVICDEPVVLQDEEQEPVKNIYVYVSGEVMHPGVYLFEEGARVFQAIEAAGGMTPDANDSYVNQAGILQDGEQIYIPAKQEETLAFAEKKSDGKININTASVEELTTISGIGKSRAEAIVAFRKENGQFRNIQDIMEVSGIKEGLYQKIKDKIKI